MSQDFSHPQLGPSRIAFPDPVGWPILLGGLATLGLGLAIVAMAATDTHTGGAVSDMLAGLCVIVAFVGIGLALTLAGIRSVITKPVWHVCDYGIGLITKSGGVRRMVLWQAIPQLQIVHGTRGGQVVRYSLRAAPVLDVTVPSRDIAERAYQLWQKGRQPR